MKKTEYQKNVEMWEKRDVWLDAILLSFDRPIVYDYPFPDGYRINERAKAIIAKLRDEKKIPQTLAKSILKQCWAMKDDYSDLERHIINDRIFGHEWFYGYGILYRWRDGENTKARDRIDKYMSKAHKRYIPIIQEAMKPQLDRIKTLKIEAFELDKVMRVD